MSVPRSLILVTVDCLLERACKHIGGPSDSRAIKPQLILSLRNLMLESGEQALRH